MKKLKEDTEVKCIKKHNYFTKGKIYKVNDSDLDIGRVWCTDDNGFTEMLDKGEWELANRSEVKSKISTWGDW